MGFVFNGSGKLSIAYQPTGAQPVDRRAVVETIEDLYGSNKVWDDTNNVYPNMLVAVANSNELYMLKSKNENGSYEEEDPNLESSWKKIGVDEELINEVNGLSETVSTHNGQISNLQNNKVSITTYTADTKTLQETINGKVDISGDGIARKHNINNATDLYILGVVDQEGESTTFLTSTGVVMNNGLIKAGNGFYQESDERFKVFHKDVEVDFEQLKKLPKKHFTWVHDDENMHIGTSAQAVQAIYPDMVSEDKNGKLSVDYSKLSILALKAVDMLYDENQQLKMRMTEIENDLKIIKEKLGL